MPLTLSWFPRVFRVNFAHSIIKYYLKHAYRSALSDIKCEAQAERFISHKARLQVL